MARQSPVDTEASPPEASRDADTAARQWTEKALIASEERYRLLVDSATVGITVVQDGHTRFANPWMCAITGRSQEELLRIPFADYIHPDDLPIVREQHRTRMAGDQADHAFSFRVVRPSGEVVWNDVNSVAIIWEGRQASLAFNRDVTEQKRLELHLAHAQKMQAIGTLAAGIAHDFNNILTAIVGYTELGLAKLPDEADAREDLQAALQAAQRAADLVKQILAFSRQTNLEQKPVQVKAVAREALKLLRASAPSTIEFREDLASTAQVLADPSELHRIFLNLGTNAVLAMQETGGVLSVALRDVELDALFSAKHPEVAPGRFVRLTLSDTGCGMSDAIRARMFEPFFTTRAPGEGTGMGLSVVHGIVMGLRGSISVESEPGRGTTFEVFLPAQEDAAEPVPPRDSASLQGRERVLFVDDEPMVVDVAVRMLTRLGYRMTGFTDSRKALAAFRTDPDAFDLVITDMTMPGLTGDALAQEVRAVRPGMPLILCTGYSHKVMGAKPDALGVDEIAPKPIAGLQLAAVVRKVLDGR